MLQVEQVLENRYKLQRQLGDNGVRQAWLATDLAASNPDKSQVVVKLLAFGGTVQWEDLKLFEREAQILKQLDHPRIPKYVDYFCIDERALWFCLVQEYIRGESLKHKLATGQRYTELQVRKIAKEVLHILIHLHDLSPSVLHRDIKPSNLIWGEDNHVYLIDFGAVQDKAAKEGVTFTVVGTYGYAPMEQFGGRATPASDLYALGATLIHLLTGVTPADLPVRDLQIQFQDKVNISTKFVYWLEQLTQPSLEHRISSAKEALSALKANRLPHILRTIRQPLDSRIELKKSAQQLLIKLPMQSKSNLTIFGFSLKLLFLAWIGLILLGGSLTFLFTLSPIFGLGLLIVLWLMWLNVIDKLMISSWGHQRVYFTSEYFAVEWWLFNFCRHKVIGTTADIEDVFQSVLQTGKQKTLQLESLVEKEMVTIQTRQKRYSFGVGLSAMECLWLANEIKDWLRLHYNSRGSYSEVPHP